MSITAYQACYFSHELTRLGAIGELDRLSTTLFDSKVDLNPHQVDAALFALSNPLQKGVILADEVGLGKTIEAGLVLCQRWAERRRKLIVVVPAHIRKQWHAELSEKFNLPAVVIDRKVWGQMHRNGHPNPFDCDKIAVISYGFAARMKDDLRAVPFDLVVLDEAHKMRNAYQPSRAGGQWETVMASLDSLAVRKDRADRDYIYCKRRPHEDGVVSVSSWFDAKYSATEHGTALLKSLFRRTPFSYPKSIHAVVDSIYIAGADHPEAIVIDFFGGSGTTAHAVINLNRRDEGRRQFILVEVGDHFHTVLKPRIAKVLYSPDWKDGKAQTHGQGTSALVKYFALESYEDALNNLPDPIGMLTADADAATKDALLTYALDLELGPHLLNLDIFADPWGYSINAQAPGSDEIVPRRVDLVETFNYLLGLKVHSYGPMERYAADFERAKHPEGLGRLKVKGRLRRDAAGPFVLHRVEGELNDGQGTRVLVIWRKLTATANLPDDKRARAAEEDAAVLDAWMARHGEDTKERSEYRAYQRIYVNGPVTLRQPTQEIRTVLPIEQTFKDRMFEDTDGPASNGGAA